MKITDSEKETIYYIYKIINTINRKTYIGQRKKPENKSIESDKYMGSGWLLKKAFKKYGKENFIKEILHVCKNKQDIDEFEKFYINEERKIGKSEYNICDGGQGGNIIESFSEERKSEIKEKIRQSTINFYNNGGKSKGGTPRKIICLNDLKIWNTVKEAAEYYKIGKENISLVIRKKQKAKSAGGFLFELYDENKNYKIEERVHTKKRKIFCIENNKIYNSVIEASKDLKIGRCYIFTILTGRKKKESLYNFKYID